MLKERQIEFNSLKLTQEDIYLAMGCRGQVPDEMIRGLVAEVSVEIAPVCIPRYMYRLSTAKITAHQHIQVGEVEFAPGGIIGSYLSGMTQVCLFVATAGKEYDAYLHGLKETGNIVKEFVADAIGSVIAEACVTELGKELEQEFGTERGKMLGGESGKELKASKGLHLSLPYSPGYCGWNIAEQQKLFSFFPPRPCGITLSASSLMSPIKSISGFFGLGAGLHPQPYRCEICMNKHCYKRKEKII